VKSRALIWSARARRELREIGDYIARDKPEAAIRWIETLAAMAEQAAALPSLTSHQTAPISAIGLGSWVITRGLERFDQARAAESRQDSGRAQGS
jgi:plasmid stabilization system protein ParE